MLSRRLLFRCFATLYCHFACFVCVPEKLISLFRRPDPEKLKKLEQLFRRDPNNPDNLRHYLRELNRNQKYSEVLEIFSRLPPERITEDLRKQAKFAKAKQPHAPPRETQPPPEQKIPPEEAPKYSEPFTEETIPHEKGKFGKLVWYTILFMCCFPLAFDNAMDFIKYLARQLNSKRPSEPPSRSRTAAPRGKESPPTHESGQLKPVSGPGSKSATQKGSDMADMTGEVQRPHEIKQRLSDVKGIDEIIGEIYNVIDIMKNREEYKKKGATLPKGILLYGKPGTGKTLIARAMAGESGVTFLHYTGSQFDEMFVGIGARRIRSMFELAKKNKPCIVFIDEIDTLLTYF